MFTRYALPALAVVSFSFAVVQMTKAQQKAPPVSPTVEPARAPYQTAVSGAGLVEPETENIRVGVNLPGVVKVVHVRVGQEVKPGEPLFELDDRQLLAEQAIRRATLASARASLQKLQEMPRAEELPPLRAKVAEARASLDDKVKQYARLQRAGGGVSDEELIGRQMAVEVGKAQVAKAEADLALTEAGAWQADKLVAAAAVAQAEAQLAQSATELMRLKVTAPWMSAPDGAAVTFRVLQVNVRPGEYVATAPGTAMVALGTVGRLHVRVDIDENDIPRFRAGIPGTASPRGNPRTTFPLRFVRVEPFVIPKRSLTGGNTERVDTRVLQVIYAIDSPNPGLYVGQQMDVSLNAATP
ncbi:HlyD family secretion protein [Urbifossiella limnaea]|uniref:Putative efflux pump membrane fusion protein n=1 Tax=Urbifossiella limnaea TaxID=2528023 RepID=A0A517XVE1_9BACT|nr:efflux RND transporter periplasmic adaptor subunit [Urbifossiella limnaea]QDU21485.1 putative efflux pump membrane fusion protein [Urbifossiella limnaea]